MDDELIEIVLGRLDRDPLDGRAEGLLLAALDGDDRLEAALRGGDLPSRPPAEQRMLKLPGSGAYLTSIQVRGFRGIGPLVELSLVPGPGLTIITGRNGSGKSSIAEALELALTGQNQRWADRPGPWREGWRNIHAGSAPLIRLEFTLEGSNGGVAVQHDWSETAELSQAKTRVRGLDGKDVATLGWAEALTRFRPVLSYNELATFFDKPSDLYKALNTALGIGQVDEWMERLRSHKLEAENVVKERRAGTKGWLQQLQSIDDERATRLATLLQGRSPAYATAAEYLSSAPRPGTGADDAISTLASLEPPDVDGCAARVAVLRAALVARAALDGGDADRAARTASLLRQALAVHEHDGDGDCPVCGSGDRLNDVWRAQAEERVAELLGQASAVHTAEATLTAARLDVKTITSAVPMDVLNRARADGLDVAALQSASAAWLRLCKLPDGELVEAAEAVVVELAIAITETAVAAGRELVERDAGWQPIRAELKSWLVRAIAADPVAVNAVDLKTAHDWANDAAGEIRQARLAPIADAALRNWKELRHGSNVEIASITLSGSANRRNVAFDVTVDGSPASALGVMSQGEINALALAVFLPRAMAVESPFRFLVIDDPVQSMDPAKVDGLARVLAEAARTRQVIVLTHDTRLVEAVRRLEMKATVLAVGRREHSQVSITVEDDPVRQSLKDAAAILKDEALPVEVARKVVPSFCRTAVEAACAQVARRRRLEAGAAHADVERLLTDFSTLGHRLAFAMYDDPQRVKDVKSGMNNGRCGLGRTDADTVSELNHGSHGGGMAELTSLIHASRSLVTKVLEIR